MALNSSNACSLSFPDGGTMLSRISPSNLWKRRADLYFAAYSFSVRLLRKLLKDGNFACFVTPAVLCDGRFSKYAFFHATDERRVRRKGIEPGSPHGLRCL